MRSAALALVAALAAAVLPVYGQGRGLPVVTIAGDSVPWRLPAQAGDVARGRALVASRQAGLCLLCHAAPIPEERFQGNLAPNLAGVGARWSEGQLRLRIVDARRVNPETIMPAYYRTDGLSRVGTAWKDKPLFTAQQVEDVVAYLATLR
jgi:sulfur-oxidizing protein SoxX